MRVGTGMATLTAALAVGVAIGVAPAALAVADLDDARRAWVVGQRVVVSDGCWSTAGQPILLEARTREGWTLLARGTATRDPERCPRPAYPWSVRFSFRLDEAGTRGVPASRARLLELRTRAADASRTYFTDKLVYPTRADCRAELRDWQCP